jgi:hypothetical protein
MTSQPWWADVVQWTFWFLAMTLVMRWIAKSRMRSAAEGDVVILRHPRTILVVGVLCGGGFGVIAILSALFPGKDGSPLISLVFVGFALLGAVILVEYIRVRHRLEPAGLRYQTFTGKRGLLEWSELACVSYSPSMKWFRLDGSRGEVVRVSASLMGLPAFASAVLKHVPSNKIESATTREILEQTSNGNPPSLWG